MATMKLLRRYYGETHYSFDEDNTVDTYTFYASTSASGTYHSVRADIPGYVDECTTAGCMSIIIQDSDVIAADASLTADQIWFVKLRAFFKDGTSEVLANVPVLTIYPFGVSKINSGDVLEARSDVRAYRPDDFDWVKIMAEGSGQEYRLAVSSVTGNPVSKVLLTRDITPVTSGPASGLPLREVVYPSSAVSGDDALQVDYTYDGSGYLTKIVESMTTVP